MGPRVLMVFMALAAVVLLVLSSGCTGKPKDGGNETSSYEYYNASNLSNESGANAAIQIPGGDFTFKIHGVNEFWMKANDTVKFYVVFNNRDEDGESHMFIARVFPSAVDFDVMAAYKCLHFTTCEPLLSKMRLMIDQPENRTLVNSTKVNLYQIGIRIPDNTSSGTYMYNMIACKDTPFSECTQTTTNFGPNIPVIVHVL